MWCIALIFVTLLNSNIINSITTWKHIEINPFLWYYDFFLELPIWLGLEKKVDKYAAQRPLKVGGESKTLFPVG